MRYEAPETLDAAVQLLSSEAGLAKVLAGGTDLLVQLRTDLIEPDLVVDIKGIGELRTITEEAGGYRVGAAVTGGTDSFDTASSLLTVDDLLRVETGDGHLTDPPLIARGFAGR